MSRKFLDDGVEYKLVLNAGVGFDHLPAQANTYYDPGHQAVDPISGLRFVNEGSPDRPSSLFVTDRYNALVLHEKFDYSGKPVLVANQTVAGSSRTIAIAGTNAADAGVTFQTTAGNVGGLLLTTTTGANDQEILVANTNSIFGAITYIADSQVTFETQLVTAATITAQIVWAGLKLTNTSTSATDASQAFFRYQDTVNGGSFQAVDSTGGVLNAQDTGVAVVASTSYLLQIKVGVDLKPRYLINGILVATGAVLGTGTALLPFVGVQTTTTAARAVTCRFIRLVVPRAPIV